MWVVLHFLDMPEFTGFCEKYNIRYRREQNREAFLTELAKALNMGKIIGFIQGGCEFGPRALGNRSILANPLEDDMKAKINSAVKFREPFRPFAPAIIEEKADQYFDLQGSSPYMTFLFDSLDKKKSSIPAVIHVDGTSRIQTVSPGDNSLLHSLLIEFEKISGHPVLLNTSYNLRGYPISATAEQVLKTFFSSGIDLLLVENILLDKEKIPKPYPPELMIVPAED